MRDCTAWEALAWDLDRCEHGRHEGDVCSCCGGPSKGNPFMGGELHRRPPVVYPRQIGFTISAYPIVIPDDRTDRLDPTNWVVLPEPKGAQP